MRALLRLAGASAVAAIALVAADPFIGAWRLNIAKSTFDPVEGPVRSATRSYERAGKRVRTVWDIVRLDGGTSHGEYTAKCDSKSYLTGSSETISCKQVNARTVEGIVMRNGTLTRKYDRTVSKDGQTMTLRFFAPNNLKKPISVQVYERQRD